jgi:hypothetical protein
MWLTRQKRRLRGNCLPHTGHAGIEGRLDSDHFAHLQCPLHLARPPEITLKITSFLDFPRFFRHAGVLRILYVNVRNHDTMYNVFPSIIVVECCIYIV